jgi:Skp family chaperone for outer membrane proteins
MDPAAFREAADAFDAKVTRIRSAQDRKSRALTNLQERERRAFLDAALPVFGTLLDDFGAFILLDRRQIFLSDDRVDITDEAIQRVDVALGEMEPTLDGTPPTDPEIQQ